MRDNQRKKVYTAEREVFGANANTAKIGMPLPTVGDVDRYVCVVLNRKVVARHYNTNRPVLVVDGRGTRRAMAYGGYKISIPKWARTEWVVLHELAHILEWRDRARTGVRTASHGWEFAAIYLFLVKTMLGKDTADLLKASFRKHRVKFSKPRLKRQLTPEQIAILRERMTLARAARSKGA